MEQEKTDLEVLYRLDGKIDRLSLSIEHLAKSLNDLEEKRVNDQDKRLRELEAWRQRQKGAMQLAYILWAVLGAAAGYAITLLK